MTCINCNKPLHRGNKYCSNKCQAEYQTNLKVTNWLDGIEVGHTGKTYQIKTFVRRFLLEQANNSCEKCGFNKLHPTYKTSILEINHIDGNPSNSWVENLEVLCPNCHAMTDNFRAYNTDSIRDR